MQQIEKSPTLVELLNDFTGNLLLDTKNNGAYYDYTDNTVYIGYKVVLPKIEIGVLVTLGHELGHSKQEFQPNDVRSYKTAEEYSKACCIDEGNHQYP